MSDDLSDLKMKAVQAILSLSSQQAVTYILQQAEILIEGEKTANAVEHLEAKGGLTFLKNIEVKINFKGRFEYAKVLLINVSQDVARVECQGSTLDVSLSDCIYMTPQLPDLIVSNADNFVYGDLYSVSIACLKNKLSRNNPTIGYFSMMLSLFTLLNNKSPEGSQIVKEMDQILSYINNRLTTLQAKYNPKPSVSKNIAGFSRDDDPGYFTIMPDGTLGNSKNLKDW